MKIIINSLNGNPSARYFTKKPIALQVIFTQKAGLLTTLEGDVSYRKGDALMTGTEGEQWVIARQSFETSYEPIEGVTLGNVGFYRKRPSAVLALQVNKPFKVRNKTAANGFFEGKPGDWVVQYGSDDRAVVANTIFYKTYQESCILSVMNQIPKVITIAYIGHRQARLKISDDILHEKIKSVIELLKQTLNELSQTSKNTDTTYTINFIGGLVEGADQIIANEAFANDCNVYLSLTELENTKLTEYKQQSKEKIHKIHWKLSSKSGSREDFIAHEELLLARSDILLAICDDNSQEPQKGNLVRLGGTVNTLANARLVKLPIIKIDATNANKAPIFLDGEGKETDIRTILCNSLRPHTQSEINENTTAKEISHYLDLSEHYKEGQHDKVLGRINDAIWIKLYQLSQGDWNKFFRNDWKKLIGRKRDWTHYDSDFVDDSIKIAYRQADAIAIKMNNRDRAAWVMLQVLSVLAVFLSVAGLAWEEQLNKQFNHWPITTALELVVIIMIIGLYRQGQRCQWHGLGVRARHLAEMLRIHDFLSPLNGVADFMINHAQGRPWSQWMYRRYTAVHPIWEENDEISVDKYKKKVGKYLKEQIQYHQKKEQSERKRYQRMQWVGRGLFLLTISALCLHLVWHISLLSVITTVFPAMGAAFYAILSHQESERLANQSAKICNKLTQFQKELEQQQDKAAIRRLTIHLANLFARDTEAWYDLLAVKELELPN